MSNLRPYKFQIVAVAQQVDDESNVTGEATVGADQSGSPFTVYGVEALAAWADAFPGLLEKAAETQ